MKTYVIHVSDAYERERFMEQQLQNKNLDYSFLTEGDKSDLSAAVIAEYFTGDTMAKVSSATSCAYKHILAYKAIAEGDDDFALILEDDIRFYSNFSVIHEVVEELKQRNIRNFLLSLEDSNLKYIPRSQRKKGVKVYPKKLGRMAGAYLIDKECAKSMLQFMKKEKLDIPIDWYHNLCVEKNVLNLYWSQPPIASQGSLDGTIQSLISVDNYGIVKVYSYKIQRLYKKILYYLR